MECIIASLALLCICSTAAQAKKNQKISIAVVMFKANNCSPSIARAVTDMFEGGLYKAELFNLLDRGQMDRIAKLHGFTEYNTADPKQMAALGTILKVEKIIVGTVSKLQDYTIDVRAMNAATGVIDYSTSIKAKNIAAMEVSVSKISLQFERYYLGYYNLSGKFDLSLSFTNLYPAGVMTRGTKSGYGLSGTSYFNKVLYGLDIITILGYYTLIPKEKYIEYWYMAPVQVHVGYTFVLAKNLRLVPSFGCGYAFSWISYDEYEFRLSGTYKYKKAFFYNQLFSIRGEVDLLIYDRWYLSATPNYLFFYEKNKTGNVIAFDLGIKMLF